jgi:hypothetical protein
MSAEIRIFTLENEKHEEDNVSVPRKHLSQSDG